MRNETLTLRIIPYQRINIEDLQDMGLKEIPRVPRRIRCGPQDNMRRFEFKALTPTLMAKFNEVKTYLEKNNFCPDDILIYGKTLVGFLRLEEREYSLPFWK